MHPTHSGLSYDTYSCRRGAGTYIRDTRRRQGLYRRGNPYLLLKNIFRNHHYALVCERQESRLHFNPPQHRKLKVHQFPLQLVVLYKLLSTVNKVDQLLAVAHLETTVTRLILDRDDASEDGVQRIHLVFGFLVFKLARGRHAHPFYLLYELNLFNSSWYPAGNGNSI